MTSNTPSSGNGQLEEFDVVLFKIRDEAKKIIETITPGGWKCIQLEEYYRDFIDELDVQIRLIELPANVFFALRTIKEEEGDSPGHYLFDFVCVEMCFDLVKSLKKQDVSK